ncbi:lipase family alpha/beta hydrolase [Streptosporangium sp. G11]|uniref:lipase family alpha/beta hydrolase n=1 Tax=Streptosporangium sp. G11 TaxID=3436926 RepID=UPI003EB72AD1
MELLRGERYVLWGRNEMLLSVPDEDYFFRLLTDTDGRTNPGGVRVFPGDPTTVMDSPLTRISDIHDMPGIRYIPGIRHMIGLLDIPDVVPYDDFLLQLKWRQPQLDLRVFGYDWRLSNTHNALKLRNFLYEQWGMDSPPKDKRERVSIVAHSMGGLVARSFIESPQWHGHCFVKQLITVATPHLGSPAVYNLMTGMAPFWLLPVPETLLSRRHQQELSLRLDSLAEMLPIYDFVTRTDGSRVPWWDTLSDLILYRYPEYGRGPQDVEALSVVWAFRKTLVPEEDLQAWLAWRRVRYLFLGGRGLPTPMGTVLPSRGGRAQPDLNLHGDGTVPYHSALAFGSNARRPRKSCDTAAAALTLSRGMTTQHPPLHNTDWLARKAFDAFDTDKRFPDALTNPKQIRHNDALKIANVETEIAGRLDPSADALPEQPSWGALIKVGRALGIATRRQLKPGVVCAAVLRLSPGERPPLAYVVRHCTLDHRPMLPGLQGQPCECLADRLPKTFPDVYPGRDGARGAYPRRYLLLDRQVDAKGNHLGGGAVLLDEHPAEDELFVVTWNTGEMIESHLKSNEHHAEAHLVGWWKSQDEEWQARLVSVDITVTRSPCVLCCGDLLRLTGTGRDAGVEAATVAWRDLYRGGRDGGGATDAAALRGLTKNTPWKIMPRRVDTVDYPSRWP